MYRWMWMKLPGPVWVKILEAVVMAAILVGVLMGIVFPWVANTFLVEQSVVG